MKGEVVFLYAFDVANEISTSRVHEILSARPFPFEIRMGRTLPKDMPLYKPLAAPLHGAPVRLLIRIYERGRGDGDDPRLFPCCLVPWLFKRWNQTMGVGCRFLRGFPFAGVSQIQQTGGAMKRRPN